MSLTQVKGQINQINKCYSKIINRIILINRIDAEDSLLRNQLQNRHLNLKIPKFTIPTKNSSFSKIGANFDVLNLSYIFPYVCYQIAMNK